MADPVRLVFAILLALLLVIVFAFRPNPEMHFIATGLACMQRGLTVSLTAGFLLSLLLRRGAACSPKVFGAAAGGLAGLAAFRMLDLTCPNDNLFHILAWHWTKVVVCASAGAFFCAAIELYRRAQKI